MVLRLKLLTRMAWLNFLRSRVRLILLLMRLLLALFRVMLVRVRPLNCLRILKSVRPACCARMSRIYARLRRFVARKVRLSCTSTRRRITIP